jgi:hypothetical protein
MSKNKTPEPVGFVVCLDGLCIHDANSVPHFFARGELVRADHPLVQGNPFFLPAGEADSHYRAALGNFYGAHVQGE